MTSAALIWPNAGNNKSRNSVEVNSELAPSKFTAPLFRYILYGIFDIV